MKITVKFSSIFKVLSGIDQAQIEVPKNISVDQLSLELSKKYPDLPFKSGKTYYYVNDKIAVQKHILTEGDHVRIFQTMAGG
jgi:molybdopterin converting factor small subunit